MSIDFADRRKENRIKIQFPAYLCWQNKNGQEVTEEAHTVTVSNSGASLMTKVRPVTGNLIKVTLNIEGLFGSSFAVVKWAQASSDGFRIGVLFKTKANEVWQGG